MDHTDKDASAVRHMDSTPPLIPFPKYIALHDMREDSRFLELSAQCTISCTTSFLRQHSREFDIMAEQLRNDLAEFCSSLNGNPIQITITDISHFDNTGGTSEDTLECPYHISITTDGITIAAHNLPSARHAIQTLRQLVRIYREHIPAMTIEDYPSMNVRGLSYDVSRGRIPSRKTATELVDFLCLYKYNQLQLYVEHTIALDNTASAWKNCDPLTPDDIRFLDTYCAERGIELVPSLATFGHMYNVLRTDEFKHLGELPHTASRPFSFVERMLHHTFNPTHPGSVEFMRERITKYSHLFSSSLFNIGADETFDLGTGESHEHARKYGIAHLYAQYVSSLCEHLRSLNHTTILYADIALKYPELLTLLDPHIIFANWNYAPLPSEDSVRLVHESHCTQYVCPGVHTWNRLLPDLESSWTNISAMCSYGHRYECLGMLVTDWGDYGHINDPAMSTPAMLYAAECSWNAQPADVSTLNERISSLEYSDTTGTFMKIWEDLSHTQTFSWADMVQYKELDDPLNELTSTNLDVLFLLGQSNTQSLPEARRQFLENRADNIAHTAQANSCIDNCITQLHKVIDTCTSPTTDHKAETAHTLIVMAEGQKVFNTIGQWLLNCSAPKSSPEEIANIDPHNLSSRLTSWTKLFTQRWLDLGPRAEITRIHEVISWYLTILSDHNTQSENSKDCADNNPQVDSEEE